MDAKRVKFANDVMHIVLNLSEMVFNIKNDDQLKGVFGVNQEQLETVISKIIAGLPERVFEKNRHLEDEIKNICAREFIFFQVQERWNSPQYQEDLSNFIHIFSRDIQQKFDVNKEKYKSTQMKEE